MIEVVNLPEITILFALARVISRRFFSTECYKIKSRMNYFIRHTLLLAIILKKTSFNTPLPSLFPVSVYPFSPRYSTLY